MIETVQQPVMSQLPTQNHTKLSVVLLTAKQPRGIVQIIHGALEHKERYFDFARFLAAHGYHVIISDNRGHGASISKDDPFGVMKDLSQLINDQVQITHLAQRKWPNQPVHLFGHSFGSILARLYLQRHDQNLTSLCLTGTANYIPIVSVGLRLAKWFLRHHSPLARSRILSNLSGLNPNHHQWLSNNQENIAKVIADPLMIHEYPVISLQTLWTGDDELKRFDHYHCQHPDLPILSIVGDHDKFSGGRRGLADTMATLKRIGYHDVTSIVMPKMKHEVLNEVHHQEVYHLILSFLAAAHRA
ncbi:alpha/beta hydrolase [Lentilactobacillus fungorum]|uniref:Alpha/beta hydrolase n=1 Tax=Lentilactobacillus fungorum TaxID=2201250 RepID=A0ABQ3VV27_9LACO|nr:alpha/beta hydrolase [Lentilactobacillus fungorum]GHP12740.1 alpha/beta hydrolase [Lentilactobacillus fungorum]